jgi:hypothetical protein
MFSEQSQIYYMLDLEKNERHVITKSKVFCMRIIWPKVACVYYCFTEST